MSTKKKTVWHKGPPPSVGWWPASQCRKMNIVRWWNGAYWSVAADQSESPESANRAANMKTLYLNEIEWRDRPEDWPARSRT